MFLLLVSVRLHPRPRTDKVAAAPIDDVLLVELFAHLPNEIVTLFEKNRVLSSM